MCRTAHCRFIAGATAATAIHYPFQKLSNFTAAHGVFVDAFSVDDFECREHAAVVVVRHLERFHVDPFATVHEIIDVCVMRSDDGNWRRLAAITQMLQTSEKQCFSVQRIRSLAQFVDQNQRITRRICHHIAHLLDFDEKR